MILVQSVTHYIKEKKEKKKKEHAMIFVQSVTNYI